MKFLLLLLCPFSVGGQITVSSSTDPASLTAATLPEALALARTLSGDKLISLPESTIYLTATTYVDSLDNNLTIKGGTISGGIPLGAWAPCSLASNLLCTAALPSMSSRGLVVNGERAVRGVGSDSMTAFFKDPVAVDLDKYVINSTTTGLTASAELVYTANGSPWTESRCGVKSVAVLDDVGHTEVYMQNPCFTALQEKPCNQGTSVPAYVGETSAFTRPDAVPDQGWYSAALLSSRLPSLFAPCLLSSHLVCFPFTLFAFLTPCSLENVGVETLSEGQWYHDVVSSLVYYYPRVGEVVSDAVVPNIEVLISGSGVVDVTFTGVTFAHASYGRVDSDYGYVEQQSGALVDHGDDPVTCNDSEWVPATANVVFTKSDDIVFEECEFKFLGGVAVAFIGGSHECRVEQCYFHDVSGAGVQIGSYDTWNITQARGQEVGNVVSECWFRGVAAEFHGNAAVQIGYSRNTTVSNNHLSELYYSGVSIGWGWSREIDTYAAGNKVTNNRIDGFKLQGGYPGASLGDGGGIYALGPQQGSIMAGNWLNNMGGGKGGGAFYPDEGSAYWTITDNVFSNATMCEVRTATHTHLTPRASLTPRYHSG